MTMLKIFDSIKAVVNDQQLKAQEQLKAYEATAIKELFIEEERLHKKRSLLNHI